MEYLDLFIEHLRSERNSSKNTVSSYISDLKELDVFVQKKVADIGAEDIRSYLKKLDELGFKISTIRRRLTVYKQFFKFLQLEKIKLDNPIAFILQPKYKRPLPKILSEEIVRKMQEEALKLDGAEGVRLRLIIALLYGSGLRVSELISLKMNSLADGTFVKVFGKGRKERSVPVSRLTVSLLSEWQYLKAPSNWMFPSQNVTKHITRQRVFQILKAFAVSCGVNANEVSPHVFRHAFATHILDNGADLMSVKKMLGHKNIATTEIYTHVSGKKLKKVVEKFHPLSS